MLKLRYENVVWSLPMMFGHEVICYSFLDLLKQNNIEPNFEVYGSTLNKWNSGLYDFLETDNVDFVERTVDNYRLRGASPILSFDKFHLLRKDLDDEYCNSILKRGSDFDVKCVISSERLFKYVKKQFPDMYCIASSINAMYKFKKKFNPEEEAKYYNKLLKSYDRIILRPSFVKTEFINKIEDLSKVEVIVNAPNILNHGTDIEYYEFFETQGDETFDEFKGHKDTSNKLDAKLFLSFEEIENLINMGVKHSRILPPFSGQSPALLANVINFMFAPSSYNTLLFEGTFENFEATKYFYANEIIKDTKIRNLQYKKVIK